MHQIYSTIHEIIVLVQKWQIFHPAADGIAFFFLWPKKAHHFRTDDIFYRIKWYYIIIFSDSLRSPGSSISIQFPTRQKSPTTQLRSGWMRWEREKNIRIWCIKERFLTILISTTSEHSFWDFYVDGQSKLQIIN